MRICKVKMIWEEDVWHSELEGEEFSVTLESSSFDTLVERVKIAVQDILEVEYNYIGDIQFLFKTERIDDLRIRAS
ncbi:MAG: DUF1902 domain-containing protein [Defluviitaleaceae bacterium]|nr:DUF1902 domain-containing protein [Defluviitaleaceae bacterium]